MLAAIDGAIRASEMATASHRRSSRRRCGLSALSAFLTSVVTVTPFLDVGPRLENRGRCQTDPMRISPTGFDPEAGRPTLPRLALGLHRILPDVALHLS